MTIFDPMFESERENMDWVKKSEYTILIKAADKRVDAALSGLKAQTVAAKHSLQPEIAAAANRMLNCSDAFGIWGDNCITKRDKRSVLERNIKGE
jgi:hypothetical protein